MRIIVDTRELSELMHCFNGVFMGVAASLIDANQSFEIVYFEAKNLADKLNVLAQKKCEKCGQYIPIMSPHILITGESCIIRYESESGNLYRIIHKLFKNNIGELDISFEYPEESSLKEDFEDIHQKWESIRSIELTKRMAVLDTTEVVVCTDIPLTNRND